MTTLHAEPDTQTAALPKYQQLCSYLAGEITSGRLSPGHPLPTEQELASRMAMARNTVRQAFADLERQGLIRRVRGKGTFVREDAGQQIKPRTSMFALIIPESRTGYYPSLQRGFGRSARDVDHQMIVVDTENDLLRQAGATLQLLDQQVGGVAIVPTSRKPTPAHQVRPLQERGIPVVFCHRPVPGVKAPLVTFDAFEVGCIAGRHLLEHGHRRVAFTLTHRGGLGLQYLEGLRKTMRDAGGDVPDARVFFGPDEDKSSITPGYEKAVEAFLRQTLSQTDRPTAIMCGFDTEAETLYLMLGRMGVRVPQDISLIGFGGSHRAGAITRLLTSVVVDEEQLGSRAAALLNDISSGALPIESAIVERIPLAMSAGQTVAGASAGEPLQV